MWKEFQEKYKLNNSIIKVIEEDMKFDKITKAQNDNNGIDTRRHAKPKVHEGALSTKTCMWNRAASECVSRMN